MVPQQFKMREAWPGVPGLEELGQGRLFDAPGAAMEEGCQLFAALRFLRLPPGQALAL